LSAKKT